MDFFNRTRAKNKRKVQGQLIQNIHFASQHVQQAREKGSELLGKIAMAKEQPLSNLPSKTTTPTKMSALLKNEPNPRDPSIKVGADFKAQLVSKAVESSPEYAGWMSDGVKEINRRVEVQKEAVQAARAGGVSRRKVNKALKQYK